MAASAARVSYIATAPVDDDPEMIARIGRHRAARPAAWKTIEEPIELADVVEKAARDSDAIIVDCLTIWLSNLFFAHRDAEASCIEDSACAQLQRIAAAAECSHVILVSNELGSGTVPEPALTRAFRDTQGILNQRAAELATEVILTVAGLPVSLKSPESAREVRP